MNPTRSVLSAIALMPLLAACVSAGGNPILIPTGSTSRPTPTDGSSSGPPRRPAGNQQTLRGAGLDGVIGAGAAQLLNQFGNPQLDVREGDTRKLQFAGEACVLDIFLYPEQSGSPPIAAHVEARRASDGRNVDRSACIRALRRR